MTHTGYHSSYFSRTATRAALSLFFLFGLIFISCSGNYKRITLNDDEKLAYLKELETFRAAKDSVFRSGESSPLTREQRIKFEHLNYFSPNLNLIFRVKLIPEKSPEQVKIQATRGDVRSAVKLGRFEFDIAGNKLSLFAYRMIGDNSEELFVPFTDQTCGTTSYAGGRYIDLNENSSGEYVLDFNYAYNPYCAYNHNYSCPIVPQENHLDAAVTAGEMKY